MPETSPQDEVPAELPSSVRSARWAGVVVQGLILGVLLFGASVTLLVVQSGARIFRYENF